MGLRALCVHAGPRARERLRERGLQPADVRVIPAAAGGPKGLVLNWLDRFLFADWLPRSTQTVHLIGASIGAWRMATACLAEPRVEFGRLAEAYVAQHYEHAPGKPPTPQHVSSLFAAQLEACFGGREAEVLGHPRYRLHVFTSRGRGLLHRDGRRLSRLTTPLGYAGAFAANALGRRALGSALERVVFSDPREPLPLHLHELRSRTVALDAVNLRLSILASCSIPFWLLSVRDIPGAPPGAYWDGGLTDYHLHLNYATLTDGLVLYPHFQSTLVPGWLDKALKHRHRATGWLSNVVLLSPNPAWVATLPNAKLPDRNDFVRYGDDLAARTSAWTQAVSMSEQLADEFADWVDGRRSAEVQPLV